MAAYDKKLYKEFVLMSLSRWREGMVAMRWRTEDEVKAGKGTDTCAELECGRHARDEQEVLFAYKEDAEQKEALVKVRLCGGCRDKLGRARERERKKGAEKKEDRSRSRSRSRSRRTKDSKRHRRRSRSRSPPGDADEVREHQRHRRRGRSRSPSREHGDTERRSRRKRSKSGHRHHPKHEK